MSVVLLKIEEVLAWSGTKYLAVGLLGASVGASLWQMILISIALIGFDRHDQ